MPLGGLDWAKRAHLRAQASSEYLIIYSVAILLIAILAAMFYFFVIAPSSILPNSCSFSYGATCSSLIFGSNSTASSVAVFLTNPQEYPIIDPVLFLNSTYIGSSTTACKPNFVLPGGAILCNVTISSKSVALGTLVNGKLFLRARPCPSGNASSCSSTPMQTYAGSFTSHVSPILSSTPIQVSLSAANTTQAADGMPDMLTATVKMLGYPVASATVNFSVLQSQPSVTIQPKIANGGANGVAISHISSMSTGQSTVIATFAGAISNPVTINFVAPVYITFESSLMQGANSNLIVYVDGTPFIYSQMPVTLAFSQGTTHTFSFAPTVSGNAGARYALAAVSGCGVSQQSGSITATSNCTVSAAYATQYYLSVAASPSGSAATSPSSGYYNAGNQVTISVAVTPGNKFKGWVGTGNGNYTGTQPTATVTMDAPITEVAYIEKPTTTIFSARNFYLLHRHSGNGYQCPSVGSPTEYINYQGKLIHTYISSVSTSTYTLNGKTYTLCQACIPYSLVAPGCPPGDICASCTVNTVGT
ncbi:MAG: hypothetical protein QXW57_04595 [Candidatus Micrarchaeaceae archaeon]